MSRRSFGVNPAAGAYASPFRPEHPGMSPGVQGDLDVARTTGANVLLVGPEPRIAGLVTALVPDLDPDAMIRGRNERLLFTPASSRAASTVIRNVDALTAEEQLSLLEWMESARKRTQVVSTATAPLLPLVETGAFNASLYYRLNTIYIHLPG